MGDRGPNGIALSMGAKNPDWIVYACETMKWAGSKRFTLFRFFVHLPK